MGKFASTWKLVRQSFTVLTQEKRLLFFPVVTSFLTVFIFLFFIAPIPFQRTGYSYLEQEHWEAVAESILREGLPRGEPGEVVELDTWFVGYLAVGSYLPTILMPTLVVVVGAWLLSTILVAYFENVINKVFQCALYIYAAEGVIPGPFDQALLDAAWKVKKTAG